MPGTLMFDAALKWDVLKNEQDFSALIVRYQKLLDNLKIKLNDKNLGLDKGSVEKLFDDVSKNVGDQITQKIKDALKNNQPIEASFFTGLSKNVAESISRGINAGARNSGDVKLKAMVDTQSTSPIIMQFRDALKNTHDTLKGAFKDRPAAQTWDKKPNYDVNANRQLMDVRVVNRGSDPIPIDFVKTSNEVSSMLASHFNLLQHTIEAGLTSVAVTITQSNGGSGSGGGGNGQRTKTSDILNAERDINATLRQVLKESNKPQAQDAKYYGGDLTGSRLADVIKDLRDQIKRIDRSALNSADRAEYQDMENTLNDFFAKVNRQLETAERRRAEALEDFENGVADPNKTVDETYRDKLRSINGDINKIFTDFVKNHTGYLDQLNRIPEQLNNLTTKTRKSADGFGGGVLGMLRDFQMIGIQVPPSLQRIISYTTTLQDQVFKRFGLWTDNPGETFSNSLRFAGRAARVGRRAARRTVSRALSRVGFSPRIATTVGRAVSGIGSLGGGTGGLLGSLGIAGASWLPGMAALVGGGMYLKEWYDRWGKWQEAKRERELKDATRVHDLRMKHIEQEFKLTVSRLDAMSELEKTRLKNQSELSRMRMEMNSADIETQERLNALEMMRTQWSNNRRMLKQQSEFSSENFDVVWNSTYERNKDSMGSVELLRGMSNLGGAFEAAYNKYGQKTDSGFVDLARVGWLDYNYRPKAMEANVQIQQQGYEEITKIIKNSLDYELKVEQAVLDQLASMEGTIGTKLQTQIEETIKNGDALRKEAAENMNMLQYGTMLKRARDYGVEATIGYGVTKTPVGRGGFIFTDQNGMPVGRKTMEDLQGEISGRLKDPMAQLYIDYAESLQSRLAQQEALMKAEVEQAKVQAALTDAYLQQAKEVEELRKSLRADLFKHVISSVQEISKWDTSNAEKLHSRQMWGLEARQQAQLKDSRYLLDQDAKQYLELVQAEEKQIAELLGSLDRSERYSESNPNGRIGSVQARQEWESWELVNIKQAETLFQLLQKHEDEYSNLRIEGIKRTNTAEIACINQRKELSMKAIDTALAQWKAVLDPYGKNAFELQKELDRGQIEYEYAEKRSEMEQTYQKEVAQREMEYKQSQLDILHKEQLENQEIINSKQTEWMQKRHQLEIQLLEIEFALRLKQIEYEVRYKKQLEDQQKEMDKAGAQPFTQESPDQYTDDEIAILRGKPVKELTIQDRIISEEDEIKLGEIRRNTYRQLNKQAYDMLKSARITKEVETDEGTKALTIDDFIEYSKEQFLRENQGKELSGEDALYYNALLKEKENPSAYRTDVVARGYVEAFRNSLIAKFGEDYRDTGSGAKKSYSEAQQKGLRDRLRQIEGKRAADNLPPPEDIEKRVEKETARQLEQAEAKVRQWESIVNSLPESAGDLTEDPETKKVVKASSELKRWKQAVEDLKAGKGDVRAEVMRQWDVERREGWDKEEKEIKAKLADAEHSDKLLSDILGEIGTYGTAFIDAVTAQAQQQEEANKANKELAAEVVNAVNEPVEINGEMVTPTDVHKEMEELKQQEQQDTTKTQNELNRASQERQAKDDAKFEKDQADKAAEHELNVKSLDANKEVAVAVREASWNIEQRQSQFNADMIKIEGQRSSSQLQTDTAAAIELLQVKDGTAWMKAIMKRNQETMFNQQTAYLAEKHRIEMEEYKAGGNVTEEGMAELEVQQQTERDQLQSAKQIGDAVRDSLNGVGALRSLVTEGTGSKIGLTEGWEKIQAAAFGHVIDPTADAITQLNKMSQLQHASLMNLLTQSLPAMVTNTANMKPSAFANMIRGLTQPQVNNNFYEGGGLAED